MKVIVCDDELYFVEVVSDYCKKFEGETGIPITLLKFEQGREVLTYCKENRDVDLFILDIKMEHVDGLEVAKEIRKSGSNAKIVFLTSAIEFAPQGYVLGVSRYWMKPLLYKNFCLEMKELYQDIQKESNAYIIESIGTITEKVYYDEILYIETYGRKARIQRINSSYMSGCKLNAYEDRLDTRFFRCHAAYIVNMNHISKIKGLEIILGNGESIYMSKGKRKNFLAAFNSYYNSKEIDAML